MRKTIRTGLLASALALGGLTALPAPAFAASVADSQIGFATFQRQLAEDGDWFYSDRWGMVWQPYDADGADWRPYSRGHWANTYEYGWLWVSDERFGDIAYHYGRWVNDPDDGWLWLPGYVWSPAWVVWRQADTYTGWMPMPPDRRFLSGDEFGDTGASRGPGVAIDFNTWDGSADFYGYARWYGGAYSQDRFAGLWTFVPVQHFADRDYARYVARRGVLVDYVRRSRNVTNYTIVNNYIVNRSVDVKVVYRDRRGPVRAVRAAEVIRRPSLIARIDLGRDVSLRMRVDMPRGRGEANSAPKPTRTQVDALTPAGRDRDRSGGGAGRVRKHLLDRNAAEVVARPNGSTPATLTPADVAKAKSNETGAKPGGDASKSAADQTAKAADKTPPSSASPPLPPDNGAARKRNPRPETDGADNGSATVTPDTATGHKHKPRPDATPDNAATPEPQPAAGTATPGASDAEDKKAARAAKKAKQTDDNATSATPPSDTTPPDRPHKARTPDTSNATGAPTSLAPATDEERAARRRARAAADAQSATPPAASDTDRPSHPHRDRTAAPDTTNAAPNNTTPANNTDQDKPKKHKHNADADAPPQ
ncbi:MAG TPA: DUF6600 domain-containing protein [Rhizomicrobium sp.]|jgi:hypothetical protein